MNKPSAEDLAFPVITYRNEDGVTQEMLRPYWREHPEIFSIPIPATTVVMATWLDGTVAGVPAGADAKALSMYYTASLIAAVTREMQGANLEGEQP